MLFLEYLPPGARPCAILPYQQKDPRGFIDTGNELAGVDPHVYLSYQGIKQASSLFGFVEGEELAAANELNAELEHRIAQLEEELAEADRFKSHIDGLKTHGFMIARAPGRPKTKAA